MNEKYPEVLNVSDIQKILKIGKRQAYHLVKSGSFYTVRIGRTIKIPKESFEKWLKGV